MREGARWRAVIQSPLPYALRVELLLDDVVPCERLATTVTGDIEGRASLHLTPTASGSAIDIEWHMRPRSRAMQMAGLLARPLLRWSHEWVLARGLEQFRQRALKTTATDHDRSGDDSRPIRPSGVTRMGETREERT